MAKKSGAKGKGGAKPKWIELDMPNKLEAVTGWAKQGYIDTEIAGMLGIHSSTFYKWRNEYPEFKAAILKGKSVADGELVNAAFRNATGYYITVTEPMKLKRQVNVGTEEKPFYREEEVIEMVTYDKFIPANATQSIFMLKNRMPEQYRDKHEVKHDGQIGVTFVDDIPVEDNDDE